MRASTSPSPFDEEPTIATLAIALGLSWPETADRSVPVHLEDLPVDRCGMVVGDAARLRRCEAGRLDRIGGRIGRRARRRHRLGRYADDARARNPQGMVTQNQVEEKPPETRSAGGRKFRRQGNGWVDTKFKSSMPVKSIARGSSEFNELDSGLRSIAQQLSGQVIVVWKNKAYLIK